ncbi:hypothetical protein TASIC1_0017002600 [Trichoderma asperellum]|uniref:Uncharacterized protein n=1 Tax=Trichoderma asperellum TaxID=101201 RepID=A0A6V8R5E4_TRIAP|nr:hypothetical protein LI328DRAFT_164960 [Trichoderma asperelloides]GFP60264.1 hypothetical protein TASIC1_0017002600 [Trichoderma asperellum]
MPNSYNITVKNQSGSLQQYALFNKVPIVSGKVQEQVWSNIFAVDKAAKDQQISFDLVNEYNAIVGKKKSNPSGSVTVTVTGTQPVTLGYTQPNGQPVPGTSLSMFVADDTPQFSATPLPNASFPNAYEIRTGDFSNKDAKAAGYMIGLGAKGGSDGPAATFIPEAQTSYQIQPVNTYYVAVGDFKKGQLIDVTKIGGVCPVDFTKLPNDVVIVHDDHGNLTVQISS